MKKTISIPSSGRFDYLTSTLESLRVQPEIEGFELVFSLEPELPKVASYIHEITWAKTFIATNPIRRGLRINSFLALDTAIRLGSDWNLYTDDDMVFSPDALRLANAFIDRNRQDEWLVMRRHKEDVSVPHVVRSTGAHDGLLGQGFCFHKSRSQELERWWFHSRTPWEEFGWDYAIHAMILDSYQRMWRPMVNRSQHIGICGFHTSAANYDNPGLSSPCYTGRVGEFVFDDHGEFHEDSYAKS